MGGVVLPSPLVTIVVPCFNYAAHVVNAIESIRNQTLNNFECFVVNDGSTDNSEEVILEAIKHDKRFGYACLVNSGVSVARNHGISLGTAPFVICLDADDQMAPTLLEALVSHLQADNSLGLVYSGLRLLIPRTNGEVIEAGSNWPNDCNYDLQVAGENQVPTACMYRRVAWERTGGYRQRYAANAGCGTEDANLWLMIGAIGWGIKKVTDEPLFIYQLGGRTTGDKTYKEINWLQWHPWTVDGQHPFASIATPARLSHPVRQYDDPLISVIIPVGPGHEHNVTSAIDSLEAQFFRKWEAIVVDDTGEGELDLTPFPFVKVVETDGARGAGYARNRGAEIARGRFLLFLDADDWLYPEALGTMLTVYAEAEEDEVAVYGDHVGLAIVDEEYAGQMQAEHRLLDYRPDDGYAVIRHFNPEFDCQEAIRQPDKSGNFYIWCYVTTMIPTHWHDEIGGFDEDMPSWEDWDYHIRLARKGKCFVRVSEPLLVYQFYSGHRRYQAHPGHEEGLQMAWDLVQYMQDKYTRGEKAVGCTGCSQRRGGTRPSYTAMNEVSRQGISTGVRANDDDYVLCEYLGMPPGNTSQHGVVGATVFEQVLSGFPMIRCAGGWSIDYGYKGAGDRFLVHKLDLEVSPHWFRVVETQRKDFESVLPKKTVAPTPPPELKPMADVLQEAIQHTGAPELETIAPVAQTVDQVLETITPVETETTPDEPEEHKPIADEVLSNKDLALLPGVTPAIAQKLVEAGITGYQQLLDMGAEQLEQNIKGIGTTRAELIIDAVQGLLLRQQGVETR